MSKFSQGDLVVIKCLKIPYSGGTRTKSIFPHGSGIVSHNDEEGNIHLIPVYHKTIMEQDKESYIRWLKFTYTVKRGRLVLRKGITDDTWYFLEKDLTHFRSAEVKYFDEDLFKID